MDAAPPGATIQVAIVLDVKKPFHINANVVTADYLIPTKLEVTRRPGSPPVRWSILPFTRAFFGDKVLNVFEGKTTIKVPIKVAPSVKPGPVTLKAVVHYQACDDKNCFPPKGCRGAIPVKIVAAGQPSKAINPEVFGTVKLPTSGARSDGTAGGAVAASTGSGQWTSHRVSAGTAGR